MAVVVGRGNLKAIGMNVHIPEDVGQAELLIVLVGVGLPEEKDSAVAAPRTLPGGCRRPGSVTPRSRLGDAVRQEGSHVLPAFSSKRIAIGSWIAPNGLVAL